MMYQLDLSRILSKWRVIAPAILVCAANVYADCVDCEAYKTQVVNDCNSLDSSLQSVAGNVNSAAGFATSGYNSSTDPNDKAIFSTIIATLSNTQGYIDSVSAFVSSIRATAQSLQCNASSNTLGSCDCSQYLQTLIGLVQTCNQTVASVKSGVDSLVSSIGTVGPDDSDIVSTVNAINNTFDDLASYIEQFLSVDSGELPYTISDFYSIFSDFHSSVTNYSSSKFSTQSKMSFKFIASNRVISDQSYLTAPLSYFARPTSSVVSYSLKELLFAGFQNLMLQCSSLNNYAYTNLFQFSSIASSLDYIKQSITNKPSVDIWSYVRDVDRSPLDGVSSQYFTHLTNEYLATWSANDNPNTNWFRRVELLLASMVFRDSGHQDDLSQIEDDLPASSDLSTLESSLDASELFDVDIGGQLFDNAPTLPEFGSQLPQTLVITIPSFGGDNSQSASSAYNIEIDVNSISSVCDAVRACFRFLWWGLVALLVFLLGRWFLRGCSFAFRLIQGIHFS